MDEVTTWTVISEIDDPDRDPRAVARLRTRDTDHTTGEAAGRLTCDRTRTDRWSA